jgi:hypothetical protein
MRAKSAGFRIAGAASRADAIGPAARRAVVSALSAQSLNFEWFKECDPRARKIIMGLHSEI